MSSKTLTSRSRTWMSCLTVCTLFLVTGCAVERWRPEHSTPGEAELPRIDLSIVRMAQANERVGANQIFDGTPYVVRDTRYFPIGEAILASDAKGYPAVAFRVRSEAIPEFELWTQQNVGYGMGVALDGQLIFVLKLQGPLKGGFAINGGRYGWRPGQAEAIVRRCNATRVTREAAYRAEGGGSEAQ